jgi:DNA repair protein RecO (recombination protein O)
MNLHTSMAIVLRRIDYQEADRIVSLLTRDDGKQTVIVKGARKSRSKLAGGIELFSINELSYMKGRGSMHRLTSSRPTVVYSAITHDIDRTMTGYQILKNIDTHTEDGCGQEYFEVAVAALQLLNDQRLSVPIVWTWFAAQLLQLLGNAPNTHHDTAGAKLQDSDMFLYEPDSGCFVSSAQGSFSQRHIKLLRVCLQLDKNRVHQLVSEANNKDAETVGKLLTNILK